MRLQGLHVNLWGSKPITASTKEPLKSASTKEPLKSLVETDCPNGQPVIHIIRKLYIRMTSFQTRALYLGDSALIVTIGDYRGNSGQILAMTLLWQRILAPNQHLTAFECAG